MTAATVPSRVRVGRGATGRAGGAAAASSSFVVRSGDGSGGARGSVLGGDGRSVATGSDTMPSDRTGTGSRSSFVGEEAEEEGGGELAFAGLGKTSRKSKRPSFMAQSRGIQN